MNKEEMALMNGMFERSYEQQKEIIELKKENYDYIILLEKLKETLEEIREKWNEFKSLSPLEISFKQKQVYELDKAINNEVLK